MTTIQKCHSEAVRRMNAGRTDYYAESKTRLFGLFVNTRTRRKHSLKRTVAPEQKDTTTTTTDIPSSITFSSPSDTAKFFNQKDGGGDHVIVAPRRASPSLRDGDALVVDENCISDEEEDAPPQRYPLKQSGLSSPFSSPGARYYEKGKGCPSGNTYGEHDWQDRVEKRNTQRERMIAESDLMRRRRFFAQGPSEQQGGLRNRSIFSTKQGAAFVKDSDKSGCFMVTELDYDNDLGRHLNPTTIRPHSEDMWGIPPPFHSQQARRPQCSLASGYSRGSEEEFKGTPPSVAQSQQASLGSSSVTERAVFRFQQIWDFLTPMEHVLDEVISVAMCRTLYQSAGSISAAQLLSKGANILSILYEGLPLDGHDEKEKAAVLDHSRQTLLPSGREDDEVAYLEMTVLQTNSLPRRELLRSLRAATKKYLFEKCFRDMPVPQCKILATVLIPSVAEITAYAPLVLEKICQDVRSSNGKFAKLSGSVITKVLGEQLTDLRQSVKKGQRKAPWCTSSPKVVTGSQKEFSDLKQKYLRRGNELLKKSKNLGHNAISTQEHSSSTNSTRPRSGSESTSPTSSDILYSSSQSSVAEDVEASNNPQQSPLPFGVCFSADENSESDETFVRILNGSRSSITLSKDENPSSNTARRAYRKRTEQLTCKSSRMSCSGQTRWLDTEADRRDERLLSSDHFSSDDSSLGSRSTLPSVDGTSLGAKRSFAQALATKTVSQKKKPRRSSPSFIHAADLRKESHDDE